MLTTEGCSFATRSVIDGDCSLAGAGAAAMAVKIGAKINPRLAGANEEESSEFVTTDPWGGFASRHLYTQTGCSRNDFVVGMSPADASRNKFA